MFMETEFVQRESCRNVRFSCSLMQAKIHEFIMSEFTMGSKFCPYQVIDSICSRTYSNYIQLIEFVHKLISYRACLLARY